MRNIKTKYYVGKRFGEPIQTNSGTDANMAVAQAVLHMQIAHYRDQNRNPATACEVYDNETGTLHAVVTRSPLGAIQIAYKRNPEEFERRIAIGALFDKPKRGKK